MAAAPATLELAVTNMAAAAVMATGVPCWWMPVWRKRSRNPADWVVWNRALEVSTKRHALEFHPVGAFTLPHVHDADTFAYVHWYGHGFVVQTTHAAAGASIFDMCVGAVFNKHINTHKQILVPRAMWEAVDLTTTASLAALQRLLAVRTLQRIDCAESSPNEVQRELDGLAKMLATPPALLPRDWLKDTVKEEWDWDGDGE